MKEFNYERAWKEYVRPEFLKLAPAIVSLLGRVRDVVDSLGQDRSLALVGQTPELVAAFDEIPVEELAWASKVVYYFGHLAPDGSAQGGGLYWKFEKLADASIINRAGQVALQGAKARMDEALSGFHDHKEGTEYSVDELPEFLRGILPELGGMVEVLKADYVNCKPHPFMIGPRHFPKDGGMYIDPRQAPCAMSGCNLSYDEHTSDLALFIRTLTEDENVVTKLLKRIIDVCKGAGIKLSGFALVR